MMNMNILAVVTPPSIYHSPMATSRYISSGDLPHEYTKKEFISTGYISHVYGTPHTPKYPDRI